VNKNLLCVLLLLPAAAGCQSLPSIKPVEHVREYTVRAPDGYDLSVSRLYRESAVTAAPKKKTPVILCHTLRVNDLIWELGAAGSFAEYLARNGYDVWMFSFRGYGKSGRAPVAPGPVTGGNVTVDSLITGDLPAVVKHVMRETGAPRVILIGHGLGATACAVYAGREGGDRVASLVTIAPSLVNFYRSALMLRVGGDACPLTHPDNEALRLAAGDIIRTGRCAPSGGSGFEALFFNERNMDPRQICALYSYAVDVPPHGIIQAYRHLIDTGLLQSETMDYLNEVKKIRCPVMIVAGLADNVAPPETARHFYRTLTEAGVNTDYLECCKANGFRNDYGHLDLVIGAYAPQEIFAPVVKWIRKSDVIPAPTKSKKP